MWVPPFGKKKKKEVGGANQPPFLFFIVDVSQTGVYLKAFHAKRMMVLIQR